MSLYRKIRRYFGWTIMGVGFLAFAAYLFNYLAFQRPLQKVIQEDCRNDGIVALSHLNHHFDYRVLVYDVRQVGRPGGPVAVFRSFFQYAKEMEDWEFETIVIAYRGDPKFMIDGELFTELGDMYGHNRPVEIAKHFAHNLRFMNGDRVMAGMPGNYAVLLKRELEGDLAGDADAGSPMKKLFDSMTVQ